MNNSQKNISKDKFVFVNTQDKLHDKELVTKPIGYFKDAFNRFKRNKGSLVAAFIIGFLLLFAIIGPFLTPFKVADADNTYAYSSPRIELLANSNIGFMDGCKKVESPKETFYLHYATGQETGNAVIKNNNYEKITIRTTEKKRGPQGVIDVVKEVEGYKYRVDTIHDTGVVYMNVNLEQYRAIQKYQDENGIQIIYPAIDSKKQNVAVQDSENANYWFETEVRDGKTVAKNVQVDSETGEITFNNIYKTYSGKDDYTSKMRVEGQATYSYDYAIPNQTAYKIRVLYYEYYKYYHKVILQDRITEPTFIFGSDDQGKDIFVSLASGARFSFILAIVVALVNLFVGAIYGAIEGYYGGKIDLLMERFVEILSAVPFMIVITLLKYHMGGTSQVLILFIAFFLTGWIGMAGRTRMQFYRFKNQEYVLASRTLGAKDLRIMFKHIFPNALGTLITSCVLVIPGMIFSETSLSYLGIINLSTGKLTSVGTLLANGQKFLTTYPYMVLSPAIFISLLMLSFNLFGNGLRDAFNPSLRGSED